MVSGYMNPATRGHLEYFRKAKALVEAECGKLLVIVNNDAQAVMKKGYSFMPEDERVKIVSAFRDVDEVVLSIDTDRTVCATIRMLAESGRLPAGDINANGGDVFLDVNMPEAPVCKEFGIELVDVLGDKVQSSIWLIEAAIKNAEAAAERKAAQQQ